MAHERKDGVVYELRAFEIGELPDGCLSLLLGYPTSQEKLANNEMESFVIAVSRERAIEFATALLQVANSPPPPLGKRPTAFQ